MEFLFTIIFLTDFHYACYSKNIDIVKYFVGRKKFFNLKLASNI